MMDIASEEGTIRVGFCLCMVNARRRRERQRCSYISRMAEWRTYMHNQHVHARFVCTVQELCAPSPRMCDSL